MDNKHLEVLSGPVALVARTLCEKKSYPVQGG